MDTPDECRRIDFDETYRRMYDCYPDEEDYSDIDDYEQKEIEQERTHAVRKRLGWE